ncbi:MAG: sigma-70 family RNA polymerase sigma factor [Lewinellaceae bacterium]|nr:sigma-70 family RNA polymerase sigma factor [Phaeodactylibacter sp.]MCB9352300.1 sigma-70 family RNA polymerase sigma factor [Lewinellaceae bacterium]
MRELKISQSITLRDSKSIEKYLSEISKLDLISIEEEIELAGRIRKGDQLALEKLVKANLRFVVSVAKQYQNNHLPLMDLISEGNIGLVKAAQRYDETRGFKFISYAVWWIRQSIMQAMSEQGRMIRLPLNKVGALTKINNSFAKLEQKYEREPTNEELAEGMELTLEVITETLKFAPGHVSMDAPFEGGETTSYLDVLENTEITEADKGLAYTDSLKLDIEKVLSLLSDREQAILKMYFGLGEEESMTLNEIGILLSLTQERIRQIKDRAIRKLQSSSHKTLLNAYLGQ